jgi:glycerol-3-phosphate dehydrogenase
MVYDVVIIGGGVSGAAISRELSRYQLKIAVLEKEEEPAFGVSKSNSGIIHPGTQNFPDSLKGKLCVLGNRLMRGIAKDLGVDFQEIGELIVAFADTDLAQLKYIYEQGKKLGVPGLRMVNRDWLKKNEPNLNDKIIAALYAPTAGIISPYRLVYDLLENAKANGVELYTSQKVIKINYSNNQFEVTTSKDKFTSRYVINAAGLFADEISALVGVADFKIRPRKGEEFILDKKCSGLAKHLIFPIPSKTSKGILIIKTADGNPMIGPTAMDCEDKEDLSTSQEGLDKVLESAKRIIPAINEKDIIAYFAGLRPVAGEDFIIRHEDTAPGFINVAGIQSPGLTAAPAIAIYVKDILKKKGLELKLKKDFKPHRKKTEHLFAVGLAVTEKLIKKDPAYGDIVCRCEMVSAKEIKDAVSRGAKTLDGIKFRTRAQAGRCHGGFCTTRIMKILSELTGKPLTEVSKRGKGSEIVMEKR